MQEITSVSNNLIKETAKLQQKKYRKQLQKFLLEGQKPIFEAISSNVKIENIFVTPKLVEKFSSEHSLKDKIILVNDVVMAKIATTESVPEAVAVAQQPVYKIEDFQNFKKIVMLENIKDSGNLGTIIRSAAAFGVDGIVLCGDTTDIFNPKVVRSAVGALYKIPIVKTELSTGKSLFKCHNFIATVVKHDDIKSPKEIDFSQPFVLMFGSEADGLTDEAIGIADMKTTIPMSNLTESLNLSVAASIMFYISVQ